MRPEGFEIVELGGADLVEHPAGGGRCGAARHERGILRQHRPEAPEVVLECRGSRGEDDAQRRGPSPRPDRGLRDVLRPRTACRL